MVLIGLMASACTAQADTPETFEGSKSVSGADSSSIPSQRIRLHLQVGQTQVLEQPGVARVAVGHGQALHAMVVEQREVVLFAREAGESSLHVWVAGGRRVDYDVVIAAAGTARLHDEVQALLSAVPRVRSRIVNDTVVIEGQDVSDADRARITALTERYPQVVDATSPIGWDSMVMLDVQVVEMPRSRMRELGIRWGGTSEGGLNVGLSWDAVGGRRLSDRAGASPIPRADANAPFSAYAGINALLSSRVHAMAERGEALILAQPQLLTRSGSTADFLAGGEVPYASTDKDGKTQTVFKPYGVSLKVTPHVERSGVVRARLEVEASSVDAAVSTSGGPALKTRRASTEFNVRSGRTLVLAGFLSHDKTVAEDGLPGLRDLPLVGWLFGTTRRQQRDTELAILVTPTIVADDHPALTARIHNVRHQISSSHPSPPILNTPLDSVDMFDDEPDDLDVDSSTAQGWDVDRPSQWVDEADSGEQLDSFDD